MQHRPACGTSHRFRVKAPVERVFVFLFALRTHREFRHRGVVAVVGKFPDKCVARSALGAIDERIAVTTIVRIAQLAQAFVTGEIIRRDMDACRGVFAAGKNLECLEGLRFHGSA